MRPQSLASQGSATRGTASKASGIQEQALYRLGRTLGLPGGLSVVVTRVPAEDGALTCGGENLVPQPPPPCSQAACGQPASSQRAYASGAIAPGQRFSDTGSGLEVICTRAGHGLLAFAGRPLRVGPAAAVQSSAA